MDAADLRKKFTLDGEAVDIVDFLVNNEHLGEKEIQQIVDLKVGDELLLGGGAWAEFRMRRVE